MTSHDDTTLRDEFRHMGVMLETVIDQNRAVLEAVSVMHRQMSAIRPSVDRIPDMEQDIRVIKLAVTDTSRQQHDPARRLANLEVAHPLLPAHQ